MKYIKLEDLESWFKDLEEIEDSKTLFDVIIKAVTLKTSLKSIIDLEKQHKAVQDKFSFLRGHGVVKDYLKFKEIYKFIVKHFYNYELTEGALKRYWEQYIDDSDHTVSTNIQYNFGNVHLEKRIWKDVELKVYDEIWNSVEVK